MLRSSGEGPGEGAAEESDASEGGEDRKMGSSERSTAEREQEHSRRRTTVQQREEKSTAEGGQERSGGKATAQLREKMSTAEVEQRNPRPGCAVCAQYAMLYSVRYRDVQNHSSAP